MYERKLNYYKQIGYPEEEINKIFAEFKNEQFKIQRNTTDKMIRSFRRIAFHFKGLDIEAIPFDVDDFMHVEIKSIMQPTNDNHLLSEVSQNISDYEKNNKTK